MRYSDEQHRDRLAVWVFVVQENRDLISMEALVDHFEVGDDPERCREIRDAVKSLVDDGYFDLVGGCMVENVSSAPPAQEQSCY